MVLDLVIDGGDVGWASMAAVWVWVNGSGSVGLDGVTPMVAAVIYNPLRNMNGGFGVIWDQWVWGDL